MTENEKFKKAFNELKEIARSSLSEDGFKIYFDNLIEAITENDWLSQNINEIILNYKEGDDLIINLHKKINKR